MTQIYFTKQNSLNGGVPCLWSIFINLAVALQGDPISFPDQLVYYRTLLLVLIVGLPTRVVVRTIQIYHYIFVKSRRPLRIRIINYVKFNFPMTLSVSRLVGRSVTKIMS